MNMKWSSTLLTLGVSWLWGTTQSFSQNIDRFVVSGEFSMPFYPLRPSGLCEVPVWSGGAFVRCDVDGVTTPTIHSIDSTGQDSLFVFSLPGAKTIHVTGIAHGRNNALAIVGGAFDDSGHIAQFISWVSPDRNVVNTMRTSGYIPKYVSVAPDGTIWTVGWEPSDPNNYATPLNPGVNIVRHFDSSVKLLDSYVPQRSMPSRLHAVGNGGYLVASSDRIGLYEKDSPYREILFADKRVTEYPGIQIHPRESILGMAVTDDGSVFVNTSAYEGSRGFHLYELDRNQAEWVPIDWPSVHPTQAKLWNLLGGDGNTLMFRTSTEGRSRALTVK